MEHVNFTALRAFEAAARHLSFRAAATELHVTPAAISQQIRGLEEQLGVQLFYRRNRSLALTPAAIRGLPGLRDSLSRLSGAVQQLKHGDSQQRLNIWIAPSFASKWLIPRLPRFTAAHPSIDLNVEVSTSLIGDRKGGATTAASLRNSELDLAIRFGYGDYSQCRVDKLLDVEAVPLCSPSLAGPKLTEPDDLRHHTLIHDDTDYDGRVDWKQWLQVAGAQRVDATHGLRFNHVSYVLQAALDGQGIALSMRPLAADDIAAGRLIIPFPISLPLKPAYFLVSLNETSQTPHIAAFRQWLLGETAISNALATPVEMAQA